MDHDAFPKSPAECATLLHGVLACLDTVSSDPSRKQDHSLSLAAAHVQQAIELIEAVRVPGG